VQRGGRAAVEELRGTAAVAACGGDGMESDTLTLAWGQRAQIGVAPVKLHLVI
jgi:diacylglycerol kinase family enzyme